MRQQVKDRRVWLRSEERAKETGPESLTRALARGTPRSFHCDVLGTASPSGVIGGATPKEKRVVVAETCFGRQKDRE